MFLIDKYSGDDIYISQKDTMKKLLDTFDSHKIFYNDPDRIINYNNDELEQVMTELETENERYTNLQHLAIYGHKGCGKRFIVDSLLRKIYGDIKTRETQYIINGYGNTKEKVMIKQSKNHIIIEPNNNGFDKYLIQEIIQEYAKTINIKILKKRKMFKVVVIDKIDNLSYSAQASLRRTMEKYADRCKFIFLCDQLTNMKEPLRSRCLTIRVPLPTDSDIVDVITNISIKENINLTAKDYKYILDNCESKLNNAVWILEMMKLGIEDDNNWKDKVTVMVDSILNYNGENIEDLLEIIRDKFYNLFITNIDIKKILLNMLFILVNEIDDINMKYKIIEIVSKYELRMTKGTRYIVHFEAIVIELVNCLHKDKLT